MPELDALPQQPPGPDRRFREATGRVVGVEVTRVLEREERERSGVAENFIRREVIPLVDQERLPGTIFVHIGHLPWKLPHQYKRQLAELLAERIPEEAATLETGQSVYLSITYKDARVDLGLWRGSGQQRELDIGSIIDSGWESEERYSEVVIEAIRKKAENSQLADAGIDHRVLLLHDRMPGITASAFDTAIRSLSHEVLSNFDEIFLVDTYEPGRCLRGWPLNP